jgi:hypothetical protein
MKPLSQEEMKDFIRWADMHYWYHFDTMELSSSLTRHFFMTPAGSLPVRGRGLKPGYDASHLPRGTRRSPCGGVD